MKIDIKEIEKIKLDPGDVVVIRVPFAEIERNGEFLNKLMGKVFPDNKVMIVPEDLKIELYTKKAKE